MRKIIFCALAIAGFATAVSAQEPTKKVVHKTGRVVKKDLDHDGDLDKKRIQRKVVVKKDADGDKHYKVTRKVTKKD